MLLGSAGAQICVIGPTAFGTGLGTAAAGLAEALARSFPVCFLPTEPGAGDTITLPSGRVLPVCHDPAAIVVGLFCGDLSRVGPDTPGRLRYAFLSDELPPDWVTRLNERFDAAIAASPQLLDLARRSGVERPVTHLPVPLDLDGALAQPARPPGRVLRIGGEDGDTLAAALGGDATVELVQIPGGDPSARNALLDTIDLYVGDAVGACEAMARGAVAVGSALGELAGPAGVFTIPAGDHALCDALAAAAAFARSDGGRTARARRERARHWSISHLAASVAALVDPSIGAFRGAAPPDPAVSALAEWRLGRRADAIAGPRREVCAAHDGGFFSVFNTFLSHLAWQTREDRCHAVLPDWDVERFLGRLEAPVLSFCYGQPGDGNLWTKLFQPLFGATDAEMNDGAFLWRHAELPPDRHNEAREPLMTYVRAYQLYRSPDFAAFRRQYHRVFTRHVRLRPEHEAELDAFAAAHLTAPILIAAHVRHPSHTVEQPTGQIAGTEIYIEQVRAAVRRRGGDPDGPGWTVFVATDQERVLHRFQDAFGHRAVFFPDARRTRADEDAAFDALGPAERNRDGHQLQHLVAADRAGWSWRMAWEVVRDAYAMARCHTLLHVVSNVATAVSYMNPEIEMVFCDP